MEQVLHASVLMYVVIKIVSSVILLLANASAFLIANVQTDQIPHAKVILRPRFHLLNLFGQLRLEMLSLKITQLSLIV